MRFVLSDESVNCYGSRIITSGIDLSNFKRNPVMFYNHQRSGPGTPNSILPIGRWENIEVKDGRLMADPVFDEGDPFALQIKSKVERGFLKAASVGVTVLETSTASKDLRPGQTRPTVTKSIMSECSIVDIPGNANALKLTFPGNNIVLSSQFNTIELNSVLPVIQSTMGNFNLPKIAEQLVAMSKRGKYY